MACLEMYNDDLKKGFDQFNSFSPMSPRISFSNDFVEINPEQKLVKDPLSVPKGSVSSSFSSHFEFSVTNQSMVTADQIFSKGKILPFKETSQVRESQRTLREELMVEEEGSEDDDGFLIRPSSLKGKWKGLLGLKKSQIGSRKSEKTNAESEDSKIHSGLLNNPSQETSCEEE